LWLRIMTVNVLQKSYLIIMPGQVLCMQHYLVPQAKLQLQRQPLLLAQDHRIALGIATDEIALSDFEETNEQHLLAAGVCREHASTAAAQEASGPCCSGACEAAAASKSYKDTAAGLGGPAAASALEAVALDSNGAVVIQRQVYAEPQQAYTVIWNEDGSHCAFGQKTISSLLTNNAATTSAWLGLLTHRQLHGLVHEAGQRLAEGHQNYQSKRHSIEQAEVLESYAFFGLVPEAASDKDLEAAYRRLARQLHPDKNGGTEEAKERFQAMQARFEMLLAHRQHGRATGPVPSVRCCRRPSSCARGSDHI